MYLFFSYIFMTSLFLKKLVQMTKAQHKLIFNNIGDKYKLLIVLHFAFILPFNPYF